MSQSPMPSSAPPVGPSGLVVVGASAGGVEELRTLVASMGKVVGWTALRSMGEKAALSRQVATTARQRGSVWAAERYDAATAENESASRLIRDLIVRFGDLTGSPDQELVS